MRRLAKLFMALLRELGDENAYRRHLEMHGATHSGPEWRRFAEQRMKEKYSRAKCC